MKRLLPKEQTKRRMEATQQQVNLLKTIVNVDGDAPRPRLNSRSRAYHPQLEVYSAKTGEAPARNFRIPTATPFRKRTKSPPAIKPVSLMFYEQILM